MRRCGVKRHGDLARSFCRGWCNGDGATRLNEAQTESELINPTLQALGWHPLPQQQANVRGRADVPDALLFAQASSLDLALAEPQPDKRFLHGHAIVEAKRWLRPLDRGNAGDRKPH